MPGVVLTAQIPEVARLHDAAALEGVETAVNQVRKRRVTAQPEPERHAESVLGLGDGCRRKNVFQRPLEKIAELESLYFERGGNLSRKFHKLVVEQGIAHLDAGYIAHAR